MTKFFGYNIFRKKANNENNDENNLKKPDKKKGSFRIVMGKLSGAFMLPISLLAFAGIFLGVGSVIASQVEGSKNVENLQALLTFGNFIKAIGDTVFGILPLLFAISMAIAFTNQAAVAGFAALVLWFGFNSISSVFLSESTLMPDGTIKYYSVFGLGSLWGQISPNLTTSNQGILSFNTSVFGAIIIGTTTAWLYNKFSETELPSVLGFFSGVRLVPILALAMAVPVAILFIFVWPIFGFGLSAFGESLQYLKYGSAAFIFGFFERSLVPFGLHHVFYAPLWWTSAGGQITNAGIASAMFEAAGGAKAGLTLPTSLSQITTENGFSQSYQNSAKQFIEALNKKGSPAGDSNLWLWLQGIGSNTVPTGKAGITSEPIFKWFENYYGKGVNPGVFLQGKFNFMIFGLPAAGAAMIYAAPKENRKVAGSVIVAASATSFLVGITEPIEFTFLFLAPWLFWGIHAPLCALSFLLMDVSGAHVGTTFSSGVLDLIIYGIMPLAKGTSFWWILIYGPIYAVSYFFIFYFFIKKFDIKTPGRTSQVKLFTRKDYYAKTEGQKTEQTLNKNGVLKDLLNTNESLMVAGFGGFDNLVKTNNCASRLRYVVKDPSLVDENVLKQAGAFGVLKTGDKDYQVIIGVRASIMNTRITKAKEQQDKVLKEKQ